METNTVPSEGRFAANLTLWIPAWRRSVGPRSGPTLCSTRAESGHLGTSWLAGCCPFRTSLGRNSPSSTTSSQLEMQKKKNPCKHVCALRVPAHRRRIRLSPECSLSPRCTGQRWSIRLQCGQEGSRTPAPCCHRRMVQLPAACQTELLLETQLKLSLFCLYRVLIYLHNRSCVATPYLQAR